MMDDKRKKFFLELAYQVAKTHSQDKNTQVGAVIVDPKNGGKFLTLAGNCLPDRVIQLPERMDRPGKYQYFEHAERGAIYAAAKLGISLNGCWMFCPYFSCVECARAIINSGIKHVVGDKKLMDMTPERWRESIATAYTLFEEAGVTYEHMDVPDLNRYGIVFDDKILNTEITLQHEIKKEETKEETTQ